MASVTNGGSVENAGKSMTDKALDFAAKISSNDAKKKVNDIGVVGGVVVNAAAMTVLGVLKGFLLGSFGRSTVKEDEVAQPKE